MNFLSLFLSGVRISFQESRGLHMDRGKNLIEMEMYRQEPITFELWWLIGWRYSSSLFGDVVAHCLEVWWLTVWKCAGSLFVDVVAHCLDM